MLLIDYFNSLLNEQNANQNVMKITAKVTIV